MFDPGSFLSLPLNALAIFMTCSRLMKLFWLAPSQWRCSVKNLFFYIQGEFQSIMGPKGCPGGLLPSVSLFLGILLANVAGLLPYVFPVTSHLPYAASMALPLWVGHITSSWTKQTNFMLAHLVPLGTPGALAPFMVLIELTSSLIRPLTLSVRLVANIIAGHLLLTLIGGVATPSASVMMLTVITVALIAMSALESAVAVIQAYVFSSLSTLYLSEVATSSMN